MIKIYSVEWCGPCNKLKRYLDSKGVNYEVVTVEDGKADREEVLKVSGQRSVPVMTVNDKVIVGFQKAEIDAALESLK